MNLNPDIFPPANEAANQPNWRNTIFTMEKTLDTTNQLLLTDTLLNGYVDKIDQTVNWLRTSEADKEKYKAEKKAVLTHLRKARIKFQTAYGQYNNDEKKTVVAKDAWERV